MHIVHTNKYSSIFLGHAYNCYTREGTIDRGDQTSKNYDCQNFQQLFTGGPVHIKHVFTGVPEISNKFSREWTESPSLKRSTRKSGRSGDPKIWKSDLLCGWVSRIQYRIHNMHTIFNMYSLILSLFLSVFLSLYFSPSLCTYIYIYVYAYIYLYSVDMHIHATGGKECGAHRNALSSTLSHIRTQTNTHTHIHTHIHTYTHTQPYTHLYFWVCLYLPQEWKNVKPTNEHK